MPDQAIIDLYGPDAYSGNDAAPPAAAAAPANTTVPAYSGDPGITSLYGEDAYKPYVPEYNPPETGADWVRVLAGNAIEALPVIGKPLRDRLDYAVAGGNPITMEGADAPSLARITASNPVLNKRYPRTAAFGKGTGTALGYTGIALAAPELMGVTAPSLPTAMAAGGATTALIGAGDAATRGEDPWKGGVTGLIAGAGGPVVGEALTNLVKSRVPQAVADAARTAIQKYGIKLSADQISNNPFVKIAGSVVRSLPFTGGTAAKEAQGEAFYKAVANTWGGDGVDATAVKAWKGKIGKDFDQFPKLVPSIPFDQQTAAGYQKAIDDAYGTIDVNLRPAFKSLLANISDAYARGGGAISGARWKALIGHNSLLDKMVSHSNPELAKAAGEVKEVLMDSLERAAPTPEAFQFIKNTRAKYARFKAVEPLIEKSALGQFPPGALLKASGGIGDLAELGHIGQLFLREVGSSTTTERGAVIDTLAKVGRGVLGLGELGGAAYLGSTLGHPAGLIGGVAAPIAAGRLLGGVLRNPTVVRSLVRSAATTGPVTRAAPYVAPAVSQLVTRSPVGAPAVDAGTRAVKLLTGPSAEAPQ